MKQPFEKNVWDTLLGEWSCSLWTVILRTIWIGVAVAACMGVIRLMSWADKDMRGKSEEVQP